MLIKLWEERLAHLMIEYSTGIEAEIASVCRAAHAAIVDAGIFPVAGIRVRAHRADHAIIADGLPQNAFAAMTLSVGSGRTVEALHAAGSLVFAAVQEALARPLATGHFALSLEIRVIDPELSWKDTPIHARLTAKT